MATKPKGAKAKGAKAKGAKAKGAKPKGAKPKQLKLTRRQMNPEGAEAQERVRVIRWWELLTSVKRLARLIELAARDGVIDSADAQNALDDCVALRDDLIDAVPV